MNEKKETVIQLTKDGEFIKSWSDGVHGVRMEYGFNIGGIIQACRGTQGNNIAYKYMWKWERDYIKNN